MKVVYFERETKSFIHIHAGEYASCFYVPDENIVLYREQHGTFGGKDYSLTDRAEILEEARAIAGNRTPKGEGVTFFGIREFDYDNSRLRALIQDARLKAELEPKVKSGIEDLLKERFFTKALNSSSSKPN